jgi:cytochrome oxidase Cu insertion factor (SCO1/SenC/PrrC family)
MPGMGGSPIQLNNPLVVAIFRHALLVTGVAWILGVGLVIVIGAALSRRIFVFNLSPEGHSEPRARAYLRWGFGALWFFDGLLQCQASMPLGLANHVVAPAAAGTPAWLHALVYSGIGIWNNHPVAFAVAVAWVQMGIGLLLVVSNAGVGRIAAVASVAWAAVVWLVGNGAGGLFSTSSSFLFGWPGASLAYLVAGVWLALSNRVFVANFSRRTTQGLSVVALLGATLQALPSRGFWHGGDTNALTAMSRAMAATPQPHWLGRTVLKFGDVAGTLGGGFNVTVILWLLICAVGLWFAHRRRWSWPTWVFVGGCAVLWIGAQDLALFGGLATDVNSLPPLAFLAWCAAPREGALEPRTSRLPREMRSATAAVVASFAAAMILVSGVSMAWALASPTENTFYLAQNGSASAVNAPAPPFTLTDQHGATYRLGEHAGHYTLLSFLDPNCWTDCPLLASQMKSVRASLRKDAPLDLVAIAADPYHESPTDVRRFITRRHLGDVADFYFLTSPDRALMASLWTRYGVTVSMRATDKMSVHSDFIFIIDPRGRLRWIIPDDPLTNWSGSRSAVSQILTLLRETGLS